ncbi:MAG: hypothetical protein Q4F99_01580 [bacterium]|nr:hypothetical protein [bacterium]
MSKKDLPNIKDVSSIPDELVPVIQWWKRNGRKASWIVTLVIAASALLYWHVDKSEEEQDNTSIGFNLATTMDEFKANREQGNETAVAATIAEARALNVNGEYEAALALCANLEVEDVAMKDTCMMNKAIALEGLKRYDEALVAIESIANNSFLKDEAVLLKARLLCQKNDKAAAKALLAPLVESNSKAAMLMNIVDAYGTPLAEPMPAKPQPTEPTAAETDATPPTQEVAK